MPDGRVWVIRHASAAAAPAGMRDFDRPVAGRGRDDAASMAAWLAGFDDRPRWLVTSDARRVVETTAFLTDALGVTEAAVQHERRLYLAGPETILDVIRETPPAFEQIAIVGHNPGVSAFVAVMTGDAGLGELPTLAMACLAVALPWHELAPGGARVIRYLSPSRRAQP